MSISVEDEDVLQLLTGDDEFDAEIDEDAEEELLRDDVMNCDKQESDVILGSGDNLHVINSNMNSNINQSMDDEEDDEDRDSGRERFKSERIMSLASVPTRRREIPDSLESINVNLSDNKIDKNKYNNNNKRHNQKFRQNFNNSNNCGHDFNRRNNFRSNQGLLPLPLMNNMMPQHIQQQPQQLRMLSIQPNIYGQQFQPQINNNNNSSVHNIHVNPHFRARASNQFEQLSQVFRPQEPIRIQNMLMQSRPQFSQQNPINSQQILMNQQMRPQFMGNPNIINEQNRVQMPPQTQPPLLGHQPQPQPHQLQMEHQWRNAGPVQPFPMQQHLGPQLMPQQQMQISRPVNATQMFNSPQQSQPPFPNPQFNPNFQPNNSVFIPPTGVQHSLPPQTNNFDNQYAMETNRFPIQQNFNQIPFAPQTQFQPQPYQQTCNNNNNNNNNMNPHMRQPFRAEVPPQRLMKPINQQKRTNIPPQQGIRVNKPLIRSNEQQKVDVLKAAQMKTKRAKQILTKKTQNVKEVPIVKNPIVSSVDSKFTESVKKVNSEIEASVGVDEEYKKKMEEQKRLREEILRKKEERRKAMAAQRLKESESNAVVAVQQNRGVKQKTTPAKSQPQQQIATLLNRSPQIQQRVQLKQSQTRIVKPLSNETNATNSSIKLINTNQKRSVLIKGLASSTTEEAIKKLCKPIGVIESCKISSSGGQRNAIVSFIRSQDAIAFQSKYERTLLDLSIIQVSLIWFVVINFFICYSNIYILSFHYCLTYYLN